MAIERTYNIPLRKEFQKAPKHKRAKKAITALKQFLAKHMKADEVKIGRNLNEYIWNQGIKNPPHHVKVNVVKDDDNIAKAELFGYKYEEMTKEELEEYMAKSEKQRKKAEKKEAVKAPDKVVDKVEKKPSLAKEAVEHPEAVQEEIKGEKLTEELQKEESVPQERREEEKEIKETIEEIKKPKETSEKQSASDGAQKPKGSDKVPTTHELAAKISESKKLSDDAQKPKVSDKKKGK